MKNRPEEANWLTAGEREELTRALAVEWAEAQRKSPKGIFGTPAGFLGPYATLWLRDATGSYRVPMLGVAALMYLSVIVVLLIEPSDRAISLLNTRHTGRA
jgi:hypothetical protein